MESHLMGLTIDFSMGFVCFDAASKVSYITGTSTFICPEVIHVDEGYIDMNTEFL
jgi:hypothetical protein